MSAFVVSRNHIHYIVSAIMKHLEGYHYHGKYYNISINDATKIGQILWDENIKSVKYRYPDCVDNPDKMPGPINETFKYECNNINMQAQSAVEIVKVCSCYMYQTCEHPDYKKSRAYAIIEQLKDVLWSSVPGYEEAAWEIH